MLYLTVPPGPFHRREVKFRATLYEGKIRSISFLHEDSGLWLPIQKDGIFFQILHLAFASGRLKSRTYAKNPRITSILQGNP
jgi:hypothetical protein